MLYFEQECTSDNKLRQAAALFQRGEIDEAHEEGRRTKRGAPCVVSFEKAYKDMRELVPMAALVGNLTRRASCFGRAPE
jgi:hypothetical protein